MASLLPTWDDVRRAPKSTLTALLLANAIPLLGVAVWGWDLGLLLLLYWAESAVILAFSLVKVAATSGRAAFGLVPFFMVHAGMFMGGHLVFLLAIFVDRPAAGWASWADELGLGLAALLASHLVSFVVNFLRRDERAAVTRGQDVMAGFYGRIVVMHLTIIFGAMLVAIVGLRAMALVLLVVLKTVADVAGHVRERTKAAAHDAQPPAPPLPPTPS